MARVREFIQAHKERKAAEAAAAAYDPREQRAEIADEMVRLLTSEGGYRHVGGTRCMHGPLGGESDVDMFEVDTPIGPQRFRIAVYAMGVFFGEE